MIKIKIFEFNPFSENTYLVWDDVSREAIFIDPGCYSSDEKEILDSFVAKNSLVPKYLINTHCHIDHILGNAFIKKKYDVKFFAPSDDLFLLHGLSEQAEMFGLKSDASPLPDEYLTESIELIIGKEKFNVISTPGHTPGGHCLLCLQSNILFSGDVLFFESIGRTDLPGGDYQTLQKSILNKLLTLDDKIVVYPGHGESTTIGYEKENNPFILEMLRTK